MIDILIADDDRTIASLLADNLADEGFRCTIVSNGLEAADAARTNSFDLIVLDIMMPESSGIDALKQIRECCVCPILFLTAKSRTIDMLLGLELGADDYICKPFVVEEVVGKIKAHIRRDRRERTAETIRFGDVEVNRQAYEATKKGMRVALTSREFQLLSYFLNQRGKVLTREQIFDDVWGLDYTDIGSVTVTVKNLRDKIDPQNEYIKTVWGVGYKFVGTI